MPIGPLPISRTLPAGGLEFGHLGEERLELPGSPFVPVELFRRAGFDALAEPVPEGLLVFLRLQPPVSFDS